jgi:hypothetical protein
MTIQEDIEIMEAEKRRLFAEYIAPLEEKIQNAYRQLNEQKVEPDLTKVDVAAIADKYKIVEAVKSIG